AGAVWVGGAGGKAVDETSGSAPAAAGTASARRAVSLVIFPPRDARTVGNRTIHDEPSADQTHRVTNQGCGFATRHIRPVRGRLLRTLLVNLRGEIDSHATANQLIRNDDAVRQGMHCVGTATLPGLPGE